MSTIVYDKIRLVAAGTNFDLKISGASPSDPYILKNVDGLGPPDVNVYLGRSVNAGGYYQGRAAINRQLIFTLGLNPAWTSGQTAGDLRDALYSLLNPGGSSDSVVCQLMSGATVKVSTYGYVSKMEPNQFSKDPELVITLDCPDTYLTDPVLHDYLSGLSKPSPAFTNNGSAPTGLKLSVVTTAIVTSFIFTDSLGRRFGQNSQSIPSGYTIGFNSEPGAREFYIINPSFPTIKISLVGYLLSDSVWPVLQRGANACTIATLATNSTFTYATASAIEKYWGV